MTLRLRDEVWMQMAPHTEFFSAQIQALADPNCSFKRCSNIPSLAPYLATGQ
jgi:hypothetical protein